MNALEAMTLSQQRWLMQYWDHASPDDWASVLETFSLFSGISRRRLRRLVRHATLAEFVRGDTIVSRNAPADFLYVILSGAAQSREKSVARTLRTGDYFGEVGVLDGGPGSATVVATEELHVIRLPRRAFLRLAQHHPVISLTMLRNLGVRFRRLEAQSAGS
jgi:CRP/FNR family transcriptional regulator, cyclic AMP receptor protein